MQLVLGLNNHPPPPRPCSHLQVLLYLVRKMGYVNLKPYFLLSRSFWEHTVS